MNPGNWGWAQWVLLVILIAGTAGSISDHGRPRTNQNGWIALAGAVLTFMLLWTGGFWK